MEAHFVHQIVLWLSYVIVDNCVAYFRNIYIYLFKTVRTNHRLCKNKFNLRALTIATDVCDDVSID